MDILELAKISPDVNITIRVGDLIEANEKLIARTRDELERQLTEEREETYLTRDEAAEMLGVSLATLWSWSKSDYLTPVHIGVKVRYKMSDVKRLFETKRI